MCRSQILRIVEAVLLSLYFGVTCIKLLDAAQREYVAGDVTTVAVTRFVKLSMIEMELLPSLITHT